MTKLYAVWVPAEAEHEKDICKEVMTNPSYTEAIAEGNPFGTCLRFASEAEHGDVLRAKWPQFEWKEWES